MRRLIITALLLGIVISVSEQKPPTTYAQTAEAQLESVTNQTEEAPTTKRMNEVVVRRGDTLSKIADKYKTTYQRLFDANTYLEDPDVIDVGDKIRIPSSDEKFEKRELPEDAVAAAPPRRTLYKRSGSGKVTNAPAARSTSGSGVWDRLAACESGGDWSINTGNGYYGGLQFSLQTWRGVGGSGYPHQASRSEQIHRGKILQSGSGWGQWPACSAKLGLR